MSRRGSVKLTAAGVAAQRTPGKYFDLYGEGLYLKVGAVPDDASPERKAMPPKSWVVRCMVLGKRVEKGLGSAYLVTLDEARDRARDIAKVARDGRDPFEEAHRVREERRAAAQAEDHRRKNAMTFEKAVQTVFELNRAGWNSDVHADRWMRSFENDVFPHFRDTPIGELGKPDVLRVLTPIWATKNDTAKRIKQRLGAVFAWAIDAGHHKGPNPTDLSDKTLPSVKREREHHDAMPWQEVPGFVADLSKREGVSLRTFKRLILHPPIVVAARGVGRGKVTYLRLGTVDPHDLRKVQNSMAKLWRRHIGPEQAALRDFRRDYGLICGLAEDLPRGWQVQIFDHALCHWTTFCAMAKFEIDIANDMRRAGMTVTDDDLDEDGFATARRFPGEVLSKVRFFHVPALSFLRKFHHVAVSVYAEYLREKGKEVPAALQ